MQDRLAALVAGAIGAVPRAGDVVLAHDTDPEPGREGYPLRVGTTSVITAPTPTGVF